jgi:hypothetical protein
MKFSSVRSGALLLLLAGLAGLFAACGSTATSTSGSTAPTAQSNVVYATMYNDHMMLSQSTFSAGMPYHFLMTNNGTLQQECAIVPHSTTQMPMGTIRHNALIMTTLMMPGATHAFDYTFPRSMASQQLEFMCYANGQVTMSMGIQIT